MANKGVSLIKTEETILKGLAQAAVNAGLRRNSTVALWISFRRKPMC